MNLITGAGLPLTRVQRALAHTKMKKKDRIVKKKGKRENNNTFGKERGDKLMSASNGTKAGYT